MGDPAYSFVNALNEDPPRGYVEKVMAGVVRGAPMSGNNGYVGLSN
jgi:hypothetical protein